MADRTRPAFPAATVLIVAAGSGLGAVARHAVEMAFADQLASLTLINLTGSLALGLLVGLTGSALRAPGQVVRRLYLLLGPGFLGGYTTFSTLMVAVVVDGSLSWAIMLGLQLLAGVLLALLGVRIGQTVRS